MPKISCLHADFTEVITTLTQMVSTAPRRKSGTTVWWLFALPK
jgi:hypothetical protein